MAEKLAQYAVVSRDYSGYDDGCYYDVTFYDQEELVEFLTGRWLYGKRLYIPAKGKNAGCVVKANARTGLPSHSRFGAEIEHIFKLADDEDTDPLVALTDYQSGDLLPAHIKEQVEAIEKEDKRQVRAEKRAAKLEKEAKECEEYKRLKEKFGDG